MLRLSIRRLDLLRARASNKTVVLDGIMAGDYCKTWTAASSHQQRLVQPEGFMRTADRRCMENAIYVQKVLILFTILIKCSILKR
jgi:hypothetical protein